MQVEISKWKTSYMKKWCAATERQEFSFIVGRNGTWYRHYRDTLVFPWKFKHTLSIGSSNYTAGYLLKGADNYAHRKTCTWMFLSALLKITKRWEQPRCSSVGAWINCGTLTWCNIIQHEREMSYPVVIRHERAFMHIAK